MTAIFVSIRAAGPGDVAVIEKLESVLNSREAGFPAQLFDAVADGSRSVLLAYAGDVPCGYVVMNWAPVYTLFKRLSMPELQDLNVLPEYRRNGAGEALVIACEDLARTRAAESIGLGVGLHRDYGAAQRLYVRRGFMPDGYGITHDREPVTPGEMRAIDDNLCLMMFKDL